MIPLQRLAGLLYNTPLLITPVKAQIISDVLQAHMHSRIAGEHPPERKPGEKEPRASAFVGELLPGENGKGVTPYRVTRDGKAIMTIDGELVNRGEWIGADSGLVSYDGIKHQLAVAENDPRVREAVLDLNTPGGEAIGAFDAAAAVRRFASKKPLTAIANGVAASAGYGLAAGATRRIITPDGIGGSIGVVMMHLDISRALENRGMKPTLIFAGAHKVDGNPFEKLPESVRQQFQDDVNQYYDLFVKTVADGTGLSEEQIRDTEARIFIGQEAVDVGLFDAVGTFEDVIAGRTQNVAPRVAVSTTNKEKRMDKSTTPPAAGAGTPDMTAQLAEALKTNAELKARLDASDKKAKDAETAQLKTLYGAKIVEWERDGKFSGNATAAAKSISETLAAGESVTFAQFEAFVAALPAIDTTRIAKDADKGAAARAAAGSSVTLEDFAKAATDVAAAKRIDAVVAERRKANAKFNRAALERELRAAAAK